MSNIQRYQNSFFDVMPTRLGTMLDRFFSENGPTLGMGVTFSPKVDTYETEKSYNIDAALPGLKQEDIKVDFDQGVLTISGERKFENERNERQYHVVENGYGSFIRTFQLPNAGDADKIQATFDNGVLHVEVPKDGRRPSQHQIPIKSGSKNK
ncbi:Hsp20/alpha crystallin family protein [Hymenobacter sp. BT770]|uniref:Hsp20/alpha crystallin family protein n=1 Tax=Hymenobacter sp. BT770 TaxID=2886942 RepID=UPI001D102816|nr:Hsp20/alpha crystallin family protein [Hymenobacter sp. BT770]MCC3155160.1 Hsp20/alpha crystallin family protein [Hymenobacter sp. BT770]MDO3417208.1 Hsp20/alpha crystallin family protein [Hymenobacter sp. BT770]